MTVKRHLRYTKNRKIQWVRAGHEPAIFFDSQTGEIKKLIGTGVALGVLEDFVYEENLLSEIKTGSILILYTDGIKETRNRKGDMFGEDRLHEIIKRNAADIAERLLKKIIEGVADFQEGLILEDDITLVVIKFT